MLQLTIRDGQGFDVAAAQQKTQLGGRLGLVGMEEWARFLGGCLTLQSSPGQGTTPQLRLPLHPAATADSMLVDDPLCNAAVGQLLALPLGDHDAVDVTIKLCRPYAGILEQEGATQL